jgi:hypothetical protein
MLLRELIRRNKTITSFRLADNAFGSNAAATRSIFEGCAAIHPAAAQSQ